MLQRRILGCICLVVLAGTPVLAQSDGPEADGQATAPQLPSGQTSESNPNVVPQDPERIYTPEETKHPAELSKKLLKNILFDEKAIWTSPFRMTTQDAGWWLGFGAATAALVATDHRTSTILENSRGQVKWANTVSDIGSAYTLAPIVAGFYGYGLWKDDAKAREVAVLSTEALVDSVIVVEVLKPIAGRLRPNSGSDNGEFFDGGASFPSGHAIASWSLASVISYEYGRGKVAPIVAVALAAVVSGARFAAQQHFASDIVAGGAMGWFIGRYVWKTHQDKAIHPHAVNARFLPAIQPSSHTYALAVSLSKGEK